MLKKANLVKKLFCVLILFSCLIASPGWSFNDIEIELRQETSQLVSIAVTGFAPAKGTTDPAGLGEEAREILMNDLRLSEQFLPVKKSIFEELELGETKTATTNYKDWKRLGIQWLIKTKYTRTSKAGGVAFVFRLYDVVNERFLIGKKYQGSHKIIRRIIHRFADEVLFQLTGIYGVSGTRIAFLSRRNEETSNKEVYSVDFDGYNLKRLTQENSIILSPAWAPDGQTIAYTSYQDHNPDLIMIDSLSKKRRTLVRLPGLNAAPAWSPNGAKMALVLSKDENSEIYVMDHTRKLTRLTRHFNIDTSPAWSPDGKKMAFTSDRSGTGSPQIYIMDGELGDEDGVERISFDTYYNDNPTWSPDGEKIAYTSLVKGVFQLKIYDLKTGKTTLFTNGRGNKEEPTWSPDGRFLAYRFTQGRKTSVQIKRVGGRKSRQLTFLPTGSFSPDWSPYINK